MEPASNEIGQSNEIELLCWILGEDANCIFPVEIEQGKTIGHLKDMIKNKSTDVLRDVDAKFLTLWKVGDPTSSFDDSHDFPGRKMQVHDFDLDNTNNYSLKSIVPQQDSDHFQILMPWQTISKTWPSQPPQEKLHIVVGEAADPPSQVD
jgi:hypothetical protein